MNMYNNKLLYKIDKNTGIDEFGIDHSDFSLHDELMYNFSVSKKKEYEKELKKLFNNQNNFYHLNNISLPLKNLGINISKDIKDKMNKAVAQVKYTSKALEEIIGAISDLNRNYWDMKRDNTIGGDDYFHCKANYDATSRGFWGEKTAEILGNLKEDIDYFDNQWRKGLTKEEASLDRKHDKRVNEIGRQRKKAVYILTPEKLATPSG